jgi:hypothetical protein
LPRKQLQSQLHVCFLNERDAAAGQPSVLELSFPKNKKSKLFSFPFHSFHRFRIKSKKFYHLRVLFLTAQMESGLSPKIIRNVGLSYFRILPRFGGQFESSTSFPTLHLYV